MTGLRTNFLNKITDTIIFVLTPITLGITIYWTSRTKNINIYHWIEARYIPEPPVLLSEIIESSPQWFIYNLPDLLWVFSFTSFLLIIWNKKISKKNCYYIIFPLIFAIIHEISQYFSIIDGTFDPIDLIFYLFGSFTSILLLKYSMKVRASQ